MLKTSAPKPQRLAQLVSLAVLSLAATPNAMSQTAPAVDLGTIGATTAAGAFRPEESIKGTATAVAPTQSSLQATQPQSIITREFMDLSVAPTAEYTRIVNIAPSLSGDSANGPGLSETKITLRGLPDGYYNVTYDGIPWGDTNNPTHHSTSFFPASTIGGAVVERGPGKASDLGYATFGGSINLYSKKPSQEQVTSVATTLGTWNTRLYTVSYESGRLANHGDATLQLNYQHMSSDGYLSSSPVKGDNFTAKFERPVGDSTLMTAFVSINKNNYFQSDTSKGVTLAQVAAFGKNFQLNNDPTSMNYMGYASAYKNTDFNYLRFRTDWGNGWNTDNNLYTYSYENNTLSTQIGSWIGVTGSSTDPRRTSTASWVNGYMAATYNGHIPGYDKLNAYRVFGDSFKATKNYDSGVLRLGVWVEKADTKRHLYDLDLTTMQPNRIESVQNANLLSGSVRPLDSVSYDQNSKIQSVQPFVEYEWAAGNGVTITPGLKYLNITRSVDANVQATTRVPDHTSLSYTDALPFLTVNKKINDGLAAYAQYAKGFLIPDLNTFYVNNATQNSRDPQKTTNYQLGVVGQSDKFTWDLDLYRIDFTNKAVAVAVNGVANDHYENVGGVRYQGIEGQMTYVLGGGFALYANGSVNSAIINDTNKETTAAPTMTAALGALYTSGPLSGSLIMKRVGAARQQLYSTTLAPAAAAAAFDYYQTKAYNNLDLGVAYTMKDVGSFGKALKLQLNVFNLLNSQEVTAISPGKTVALDGYTYQAPRSMQVSAKLDF
jgi:iron complex outermembrane receptor protein